MTTQTRLYANNAKTTLASPIGASDTSIIVTDASKFPIPATNQFFLLTIDSGSSVEIIEVHGVSGNVLLNCIRGAESTVAQSFLSGTRVENRVTAGTLSSFARLVDRVADISSVDVLDTPTNSTSNSYLCASVDDGGVPILAVKSSTRWRFANHSRVVIAGTLASTGTTTGIPYTGANTIIPVFTAGSHIIQFMSGANAGLTRIVQSTTSTTITWAAVLPNAPQIGDQFEIYESSVYGMNTMRSSGDDALAFSILFGE